MEKMRIEQEHLNEREKALSDAKYAKRQAELEKLLLQRSLENGDEQEAMRMMAELEAAQLMKEQQMAAKRVPRPGAPPNKYSTLSSALKLTYV